MTAVSRPALRAAVAAALVFLLLGWRQSESPQQLLAFVLILFASVLPTILWLRIGAPGVPIFPAVCLAYVPYYGWPILSVHESMLSYSLEEILRTGLTVVLFLAAATLSWRAVVRARPGRSSLVAEPGERSTLSRFALIGIVAGVVFHASLLAGALGWLGFFFGVVRSVAMTLTTISFFLVGAARGQGLLRGDAWRVAAAGAVLIVVMALSSLFLVGGMLYLLAAAIGYVVVTKRVPWLSFGAAVLVFTILHAGKAQMRRKYWVQQANYSESMSISELPGFVGEWAQTGVSTLTTGDTGQNIVDRVSLLRMLLRVQRMTPESIDYLRGETYALFPATLVPRFIDPEKPASQVGMELLNIRYGIQTAESAAVTAIGWGLLPEAYANFGYTGVVVIALILGFLCALLERWCSRASVVSIPTLTAIASMMVLINLEEDFINIALAVLQSFASVVIIVAAYRRITARRAVYAGLPAREREA